MHATQVINTHLEKMYQGINKKNERVNEYGHSLYTRKKLSVLKHQFEIQCHV